jgi:hypothetical protein
VNRQERIARAFWRILTRVLFCSWQGHDDRGFFAGLECQRCGRMTAGVRVDQARTAYLAASRAALDRWFDRKHPGITINIRADNKAGRQLKAIIRRWGSKEGAA